MNHHHVKNKKKRKQHDHQAITLLSQLKKMIYESLKIELRRNQQGTI